MALVLPIMLEFGVPTLIENKTLEDNIALCNQLGLSFVELNMNLCTQRQVGYMADKSNFVGVEYGVGVFAIYTKRIAEMVE